MGVGVGWGDHQKKMLELIASVTDIIVNNENYLSIDSIYRSKTTTSENTKQLMGYVHENH